jgi:glycosyltransferase involved in cell wall biosynthesis
MKVALVHDYLNEFGGAERVLMALAQMYPKAPIYTAFYKVGSPAYEKFSDRDLRCSWAQRIPGFTTKLHSPLRFLAPLIWESFDLDEYDIVISSSSWYITKGVLTRPDTLHLSYIHTPPRYLYGYQTAIEWQKHTLVRMYAAIVNKSLREYDFLTAQRVDVLVANSKNVQARIGKFYRRESTVIYPPVDVEQLKEGNEERSREYLLTGGRLTGGKNFEVVIKAALKANVDLKVFGEGRMREELVKLGQGRVEFVGEVDEDELRSLYVGAKAFIALASDEDFGITPVEAMAQGTPVLAYRGGGYMETVVEGKTGVFVDQLTVDGVVEGMRKIQNLRFKIYDLRKQAEKFSKERFVSEMREMVEQEYKKLREK